jgi:hypothetical protein
MWIMDRKAEDVLRVVIWVWDWSTIHQPRMVGSLTRSGGTAVTMISNPSVDQPREMNLNFPEASIWHVACDDHHLVGVGPEHPHLRGIRLFFLTPDGKHVLRINTKTMSLEIAPTNGSDVVPITVAFSDTLEAQARIQERTKGRSQQP